MQRLAILSLLALASASGGTARAALTIRVTQTGGPVLTVTDNGPGDDDLTVDSIKVAATGANSIAATFTTLGTGSAFTAAFASAANTSTLDSNTRIVRARSGSVGFTVEASRDGVAAPAQAGKTDITSGSGNFNVGTSTQQVMLGVGETLFDLATVAYNSPTFSSPFAFAFGPDAGTTVDFVNPNPYSITHRGAYATNAGAILQTTMSSRVVASGRPIPAPGGLVLAAAALPAFGLRRLLRRAA